MSTTRGGTAWARRDLPFGITAQDAVFKHPTSYMWSAGVQREIPFGFIARRHLRRPPRPLPAARAQHQPAAGRARCRRIPASTSPRCGRTQGYGAIRLSENAGRSIYNSLQISADRRYSNGLKVGVAYTLGKSEDNGSDKRNVLWNTYDDTLY